MTVRIHAGAIYLEERCPAGDAEDLLCALRELPGASVNIGGAVKLHMAVLQVLLALRPAVQGNPACGAISQDIVRQLISHGDKGTESF